LSLSAKLVLASLAALPLAACGTSASSTGAGPAPGTSAAATAPAATPSSPASASALPSATIQAVGSEIIRYWAGHQAGIGSYSLVQDDVVVAAAKCVTLFSSKAVADAVKSQMAQGTGALNDPYAEVTACGTGNLATGGGTVVGLGCGQLSASPGPDDLLFIDDAVVNGSWVLTARQGTAQAVHHVQLTPVQVAEDVNRAFAVAAAGIASGG
jgi:hypothetical protein